MTINATPKKYSEILKAIRPIEAATGASTNKFRLAWAVADYVRQIDRGITKQWKAGIPSDQEDLAVLAFLDSFVRYLEEIHDVEVHGPIDGGEGTTPSEVTGVILALQVRQWLPAVEDR